MRTIVAWQTSCRNIFKEARQLQAKGVAWKLSQFQYNDNVLTHASYTFETIEEVLQKWRGPKASPLDADVIWKVESRTRTAKVHAEAALMHWIATVEVGPHVNFSYFLIQISHS